MGVMDLIQRFRPGTTRGPDDDLNVEEEIARNLWVRTLLDCLPACRCVVALRQCTDSPGFRPAWR